ncbi:hypothetical protein CIB48_g10139 [Xylaria polymorpha]|nr:hypothetical protein CIB48_g10139 [Xylaria polymorpha]
MTDVEKPAPGAPQPDLQKKPGLGHKQRNASSKPPRIPLDQIYALPAPLRTFPLPSFYPNNPLSLFHVLWAWTRQILSPPPAEPSVIHQGHWSPETRSVHVRDAKSIRALWEQGFFGKGSYSRSEPNWLKREQTRQGQGAKKVAELVTVQRREERKIMKWDRARKEQEAILRTRLEEAWVAPVGPKELLALPNSIADLYLSPLSKLSNGHVTASSSTHPATAQPTSSSTSTVASPTNIPMAPTPELGVNCDVVSDADKVPFPSLNGGHTLSIPTTPVVKHVVSSPDNVVSTPKRRKSSVDSVPTEDSSGASPAASTSNPPEIVDREHLQLSLEEAFYLVFGLGALSVTDPATGKTLTSPELFNLFCQVPHFSPSSAALRPDNPFLIQYAVYHHFRSIGWVPRPDPYWKSLGHHPPKTVMALAAFHQSSPESGPENHGGGVCRHTSSYARHRPIDFVEAVQDPRVFHETLA